MSNQHQLAPIIYFQTKLPELAPSYYSVVSVSTNRNRLTKKVLNSFGTENIDGFLIKGSSIAVYYPHSVLRTMGGTDIVVSDLKKTHGIMLANGFDVIFTNKDREWQHQKNGMEFELHDRLIVDV